MGALVKASAGGAIVGAGHTLPPAVRQGITDLTIAFQAGPQRSDAERVRWLQLGAKAVSTFHSAVAEHALDWLLFHHSNGPFLPTPQDLRNACRVTDSNWRAAIITHFHLSTRYLSSREDGGAPFDGPAPLEAGCVAPADYVVEALRCLLAPTPPDRGGLPGLTSRCHAEIVGMTEAQFGALPSDVLEPEYRDQLIADRARDREERTQRALKDACNEARRACFRHGVRLTDDEASARGAALIERGFGRNAWYVDHCDDQCAVAGGCTKCAAHA